MRHKKSGRQFGRDTSSRRAMLRNLAANLITHERIETTDAKAKELRRVAERLISKATRLGQTGFTPQSELNAVEKAKRLHVSRLVGSFVPRWGVDRTGAKIDIVEKVLVELAKRFQGRPGGYTRITKLGPRRGDGAPMTIIEFIDAKAPEDKVVAPKPAVPAEGETSDVGEPATTDEATHATAAAGTSAPAAATDGEPTTSAQDADQAKTDGSSHQSDDAE
jgi:large subunit ribosomal protein L17